MIEKFGGSSSERNEGESIRTLLVKRLDEITNEIAPDYQIPAALHDQMINALMKGGTGEPFTKEELENFDDKTRARIGDFLAEATRGIPANPSGLMSDAQGVIGIVKGKADAAEKASIERQQM